MTEKYNPPHPITVHPFSNPRHPLPPAAVWNKWNPIKGDQVTAGTIQQLDQGPGFDPLPPPSDDGGQHPAYGAGDDQPMEGCAWVAIGIGLVLLGWLLGVITGLDWVDWGGF